MKKLFFIIAIIFITISIPQKVFAVEYPDVNIYYENNHQIWLFNPKTKVRKYIVDGIMPLMSNKKDRLIYIQPSSYDDSPNKTLTFYIYSLSINKTEKLLTAKEGEFYDFIIGIEEWSPDDRYIVLDNGGYETRGKIIIDSITGEKVTVFNTLQSRYAWLNDHEIIFTDLQHLDGHYRDYDGSPLGISILNLQTLKTKVLRHVTQTEDFIFEKLSENNEIFFIKTKYKTNKQGYIDADQYYYLVMDKNGNNEQEIQSSQKYINPQYPPQLPHLNKNLVVVTIEKRSYIMDETTRNILIEIGEGNATW